MQNSEEKTTNQENPKKAVQSYSQTVDVEPSSSDKKMQIFGFVCFLVAVAFVLLAAFHSPYWAIAAAAFVAIGIAYIHFYNLTAKQYTYNFSQERLVIAKCDVVNRTRRMLNILFCDVQSFGRLEGTVCKGDFVATDDIGHPDVYQLVFKLDGKYSRLVFAPDRYLVELLKEALGEKCSASDGDFYE